MKKIIFLIGAIWLSGCSSMGPIAPSKIVKPQDLWELFWKSQEKKREETQFTQSRIRIDLVEKKRSLSGTGTLLSNPDGLRLEVRDPLGRLQYLVGLQSKKEFVAYYPSQNVAYFDGAEGAHYLKEFLNLGMSFSELKELWWGVLPFQKGEARLESIKNSEKSGQYWLLLGKAAIQAEALVDVETGDLLKLKWRTPSFEADFEFSEFARCCQEHISEEELPRVGRNVFLRNGKQESEIELEWVEILPAKRQEKGMFEVEVPKPVRKIFLK
jgi:outer membrane biogenesis lipoprotein LolB